MARPQKTGLDFFSLDCHMSDEVNLIIADYGMEGYGILVSIFQLIYKDKGYYAKWSLREQKLFARSVGVDKDLICEIVVECIEWGIFDKRMYDEHEVLTSNRAQRHYTTSVYKRKLVDIESKYLIIDVSDKSYIRVISSSDGVTDDGNSEETIVTDDESTQSKVKYSKVKERKEKKFLLDSNEYKVADYLYQCILANNPNHKQPNMQTWAKHVDLMLRVDKRDIKQVGAVIKWCQKDLFWRKNVLSTKKLRDQFDQLVMNMQTPKKSNNGINPETGLHKSRNALLEFMESE